MGAEVYMSGAERLIGKLEKMQAEAGHRRERAGRAAANLLKVVMRREAPVSKAATRDVARKKGRVKHLRATITVRPEGHAGGNVAAFSVGPRSSLAHLVVRGTKARHEVVGESPGKQGHRASLAAARQLRFNARGLQGPRIGEARALAWSSGGDTVFAHSSNPGPMPPNHFIQRTREIAGGEAKTIAGAVLFHDVPDPNEA